MVECEEKSNGEENVKIDSCERGSEIRKSACGVTKYGNKWRARIQHPKLKIEVWLGAYEKHEEAALAVKKKQDEFLQMFKDDSSTSLKTCTDNFEGRQLPPGVRRRGYRRWAGMIYDPKLKREISLGCYDTPEEAATALDNKRGEFLKLYGWRPYAKRGCKIDVKLLEEPSCGVLTTREVLDELIDDVNVPVGVENKMVEFEETSNGKEDVTIDTERGSEVTKRVRGVTKYGNRWRARIQHPKLKIVISLGYYDNQEEAALAVKKKKTKFLEMFKDDSNTNVKTSRDNFEGRKLPRGVWRRGYRRWAATIYDPKLKRRTSLGCFDTPEEAATALDNKRAELSKMKGWRPKVKFSCKNDGKFIEESNRGVVTPSDILDELTSDLKAAAGVRKLGVKVECDSEFDDEVLEETNRDVVTPSEISNKRTGGVMVPVGSFNTGEAEAGLSFERENIGKSPLNSCPTLDLGSDNMNCNSIIDKSNVGRLVTGFSNKLEYTFIHSSHVSVIEPEISESADISKRSMISIGNEQKIGYASEFDEAMSLGIINEYGQLVGMYSELDEQMEFSSTGEDVADIGGY